MSTLAYILFAVIIVSLLSFTGALTLAVRRKKLNKILFVLVAFASGAMLGASFLDLLPEALEEFGAGALNYALAGIVLFFVFETFFYWYHRHYVAHKHAFAEKCKRCKIIKGYTYLNLVGDGIHNFTDGVIIGASFLASIPLGIITTIAVALHEIPQELGDFGVLVYGGLSPFKALFFNFITALTAVLGALAVYFFAPVVHGLSVLLLPIAAGGFIYIATTDLLPELLHGERDLKKTILQLCIFAAGIIMIFVAGVLLHAH